MGADNVMVTPDGKVWRIDNGGSLEYRAQGEIKNDSNPTDWNEYPTEIWTLRDSAANGSTASVYGDMDIFEIARNIESVDWSALEDIPGIPDGTRDALIRRANEARRVATRALDFERDAWQPDYTDRLTKEAVEIRQEGIMANATKRLVVNSHTSITDENGKAWGNLRAGGGPKTAGATGVPLVPGDLYAATLETAYKSISHKAVNGSDITEGSALQKAQNALKKKSSLELILKDKAEPPEKKAMAKKYLKDLEWIQKQVDAGGVPETLPKSKWFKPYEPPKKKEPAKPAKPLDTRSLVQRWEARMAAKGIDTSPIKDWLSSQSGNSWTPATQAAKYAYGRNIKDAQKAQYWGGNGSYSSSFTKAKGQFDRVAKQLGSEARATELFESYHALVQETLSNFEDVPYIDTNRRAVLLYRTVSQDELNGSLDYKGQGEYTPLRGTTESHSIYKTTSVYGNKKTATAVPFTRVHGMYWLERYGGQNGSSFLGDGEAEFGANTSGIRSIHDQSYSGPSLDSPNAKDASKWGLPIDHLERE